MLRTIQTACSGETMSGVVARVLAAAAFCSFLAGCNTPSSDGLFDKSSDNRPKLGERKARPPEKIQYSGQTGKWNGLKKGMAPAKVRQLLGDPEMVIVSKERTYWYYANGGSVDFDSATTRVRFWSGPKDDAPKGIQQ